MSVIAVLQARVTSSRLPGKVLKPILGRPMLALQVERALRAQTIDRLVIATSNDSSDDGLAQLGRDLGVGSYRGSLEDVLERVYQAARPEHPDHIVRLTGDCPLTDPLIIDEVVRAHLQTASDYTTNALKPTLPDGLDVEVVRFCCLEQARQEARLGSEREHVTPYFYNHPETFAIHLVTASVDRSALRWTVDQSEDFELVTAIYEALYPDNPTFSTDDVYRLLEARPELNSINAHLSRNQGYAKSLRADQAAWATSRGPQE